MKTLIVIVALLAGGHGQQDSVVRTTTPPDCNGQRCVQLRTITRYTHGQDTLVIHKRRTAPAESRTPSNVHPWRPWHVVGVSILPCCEGR